MVSKIFSAVKKTCSPSLVLKYEFRRPDGEVPGDFTVMWDYDVGLVRITPFFKCLGFAKVSPFLSDNDDGAAQH